MGSECNETYNDRNHTCSTLPSREVGCKQKDDDRHGNSGYSESKFDIGLVCDNDDELNSEAEKEKEIELQESDINLPAKASALRIFSESMLSQNLTW